MSDASPLHCTSASSGAADVDLRALLLMMWRRRYLFIAFILAGIALGFVAMRMITPEYTPRTIILLDGQAPQNPMDKLDRVLGSGAYDGALVMNELEILRSGSMVRSVIKRLDLMADPEFNPRFKNASGAGDAFRKFSVYGEELENVPHSGVEQDIDDASARFMDRLRVRSISGSYAIQVEFVSDDPRKAALIANKISDMYIEQRFADEYQETEKITDTLDGRLDGLRSDLRAAEEKVERYRAAHNLLEGQKSTFSAEQLSQLNTQLIQAKTEQARAQSRLQQIQDLSGDHKALEAIADDGPNSLVRELKGQKAALEAEISQLSSRYGEKHPEMINRRRKIAEIRQSLRDEVANLDRAAEGDMDFAAARIAVLKQEIIAITDQIHENNGAMIGLRELEREADVARHVFDVFLASYKRSDEQKNMQEAQARVISYARVPRNPSFPSKPLIFALAGLLSIFLALIAAIMVEKLDNSYRSGADLERDLKFPCYGLIPVARGLRRPKLGMHVLDKPTSNIADAVRTLRMILNLRAPDGVKPKVITLTSSFSGEGKTTLSLWLARLAAKSGDRVIVIDSDLRAPNLHVAAGVSNDRSLVDYLSGEKDIKEIIHKDELSGAHMIFGRSVPHTALDMIGSDKLSTLTQSLREVYDLVIIDTPACLEVSDARLMATLSDHMLYVVAWNKTRRESVASGVKKFTDINHSALSFVLTHVNLRKHARYGYGDI